MYERINPVDINSWIATGKCNPKKVNQRFGRKLAVIDDYHQWETVDFVANMKVTTKRQIRTYSEIGTANGQDTGKTYSWIVKTLRQCQVT